jgi:hypothetical protein
MLVGDEITKPSVVGFGSLQSTKVEAVQAQARQWLKSTGKGDAATMRKFDGIWQQSQRNMLDRLADTFALGNAEAAKLLDQAANPLVPAPTKVPELLTNPKADKFFRANMVVAYARQLVHRRVFEESLAALKTIRPEEVVDPASYLFHRAVCEHGLLKKDDAGQSINRILEDVVSSPDRYKTVSVLMLLDMQTWKTKDLGDVARKMENIERRLDLARGGPETQRQQKEVVRRLDEIIKELENKAKGGGC